MGLQFFKEFDGAVHGFRCSAAAFFAAFFDSESFIRVEFQVLVVKLDPFIPMHRSQAHRDMIWAMPERPVRQRLGPVYIPIWVRGGLRASEGDRSPFP